MVATAIASTGTGAAAGPPLPAAVARRPLRERSVDLALLENRSALGDVADDPASRLVAWFGPQVAGHDRDRIRRALDRDIASLDRLISEQVNAILHHPRLQRLEATWRGVAFLVDCAHEHETVKLRILHAAWPEVCRDLDKAVEFDQSAMFQQIYEAEFGMPGGEPYGILVGAYEVRHNRGQPYQTDDVAALKAMSQVAAAAFCPFIAGAAPALFGVDGFFDLAGGADITSVMRQADYVRWRGLQTIEDSRFVGLTVPRVLMRLPYQPSLQRVDGFCFAEDTTALDGSGYLWGSAAFAFASVVMRAYGLHGWFAQIRGTERDHVSGGLVPGLPAHCFTTDRRGVAQRQSTDISLSEAQERQLSDAGFIPLMRCKDTEFSAFYSNSSVQLPAEYDRAVASANARLSAMLQYIFCVSRFAHFIKVIGRDRIGSFATPAECESALNAWLARYTTGNDDAEMEHKARYPLREAAVQVYEAPGKPGTYLTVIHLKPHFQLDQVVTAFRLVTELARKG